MRNLTVAKNYAEALFMVGERHGETERYGAVIAALAAVMETDETVRVAFESPRVPKLTKEAILTNALEGLAPDGFVRFIQSVVKRGRQGLIPPIAEQYLALVDEKLKRVHVGVTLAREPDATLRKVIQQRLTKFLEKEAIPQYRTDPDILGGMIVRVGDRIMDGSLRRRMVTLRQRMLGG